MNKCILILVSFLTSFNLIGYSQVDTNKNTRPDFVPFGEISTKFSAIGFQYGTVVGLNYKDKVSLGYSYERKFNNIDYHGAYASYNFLDCTNSYPALYIRAGVLQKQFVIIEPGIEMNWILTNNIKAIWGMGVIGSYPVFRVSIAFSDFRCC